jgi:hypothetical protein
MLGQTAIAEVPITGMPTTHRVAIGATVNFTLERYVFDFTVQSGTIDFTIEEGDQPQ